jgi:hypothetical protein
MIAYNMPTVNMDWNFSTKPLLDRPRACCLLRLECAVFYKREIAWNSCNLLKRAYRGNFLGRERRGIQDEITPRHQTLPGE